MKINSLVLQTKDIGAIAGFYKKILELPVLEAKDESTVVLDAGVIRFTKADTHKDPFYHFAITIPSNKIEEAKTWLEQRVKLVWMEDYQGVVANFANWNARSVYFYDAAGNIVELIARFDLHNNRNEAFSSRQFLSISEIGIVFPEHDIETYTSALLQQHALQFFNKQPPLPQFKAVGDDEGLLIIVSDQRKWYPTNKFCTAFPLQIGFEAKGKKFERKF